LITLSIISAINSFRNIIMDEDEFNDFEEAQPPAPISTPEPSEVVAEINWNIGVEGISQAVQNEAGDIRSTL
jgi:hypothetical protein